MSKPSVSLVIPTFNAASTIKACLESVLSQSKTYHEILLIDNASTDNTIETLKPYQHLITIHSCPKGHGNHARNLGLKKCTGTWVQFLDADDTLLPHKLESDLTTLNNHTNVDLIYSPVIEIDNYKQNITSYGNVHDIHSSWMQWKFAQTGSLLWRRSFLEKIGAWNQAYDVCQDNELTYRAIQEKCSVTFNPVPGACYHISNQASVCRRNPNYTVLTRIKLIMAMLSWMRREKIGDYRHEESASQSFFECLRSIARVNLNEANTLIQKYQDITRPRITGPAAPLKYRIAYHLLGFTYAERIAKLTRNHS